MEKKDLNIYIASSHDCKNYDIVIKLLQDESYKPYNWKDNNFLSLEEYYEDIYNFSPQEYIKVHNYSNIYNIFKKDKEELDKADVGILVLPCNKSAHLELGYLVGKKIPTIIYIAGNLKQPNGFKVEVMYNMADYIVSDIMYVRQFVDNVFFLKHYGNSNPLDSIFTNFKKPI